MNNEFKTYQGELVAPEKVKIAIVISRFNELISSKLLGGAVDALERLKFDMQNLDVYWVPGAFEIGIAVKNLVKKEKSAGVLCLGAVIRGGTPHFDFIASESAKAIANIGIDTGLPIIYSIITADTLEQALERAGTKMGNKGYDGAFSLVEMVNLLQKL